jgi:hypothetical protein
VTGREKAFAVLVFGGLFIGAAVGLVYGADPWFCIPVLIATPPVAVFGVAVFYSERLQNRIVDAVEGGWPVGTPYGDIVEGMRARRGATDTTPISGGAVDVKRNSRPARPPRGMPPPRLSEDPRYTRPAAPPTSNGSSNGRRPRVPADMVEELGDLRPDPIDLRDYDT